jgi:hypothetical protein
LSCALLPQDAQAREAELVDDMQPLDVVHVEIGVE